LSYQKTANILEHFSIPRSSKIIIANFYESQSQYTDVSMHTSRRIVNALLKLEYTNMLMVHSISDNDNDLSFPKWKMGELHVPMLLVAYFDEPPYSYIKNHRITGVTEQFIEEFCKKVGFKYGVAGNVKNLYDLVRATMAADINLFKKYLARELHHQENVWLNEVDGFCMLVPRNVQVEACKNLSFPFDRSVVLLLVTSVTLIIFLWWIFKRQQQENTSLLKIIVMIYKSMIGRGMHNHTWSRKEALLIFPFLFMQIVLIGFYQSWIISFMISKPSLRSVESLEELNATNTKVNRYFREFNVQINEKQVIEMSSITNESLALTIPDSFDPNLAYLVTCQYAKYFVKTSHNLHADDHKFFDVLPKPIISYFSAFTVSKNFPLKQQFKFTVEALKESGIYNYWMKVASEKRMEKIASDDGKPKLVGFNEFAVGFEVLFLCAFIGVIVLTFELIWKKIHGSCRVAARDDDDIEMDVVEMRVRKEQNKLRKHEHELMRLQKRLRIVNRKIRRMRCVSEALNRETRND
jgi:hypothetical protein